VGASFLLDYNFNDYFIAETSIGLFCQFFLVKLLVILPLRDESAELIYGALFICKNFNGL